MKTLIAAVLFLAACGPDPEPAPVEPSGPVVCPDGTALPVTVRVTRACHSADTISAWATVSAEASLRAHGAEWGEPASVAPGPAVRLLAPRDGPSVRLYVLHPDGCWALVGQYLVPDEC